MCKRILTMSLALVAAAVMCIPDVTLARGGGGGGVVGGEGWRRGWRAAAVAVGTLAGEAAVEADSAVVTRGPAAPAAGVPRVACRAARRVDHFAEAVRAVLAREAQRPAARSAGTRAPGDFTAMRALPVRSAQGARVEYDLRRRQELAARDLVVRGARSSPITRVWEATSAAEPEREIYTRWPKVKRGGGFWRWRIWQWGSGIRIWRLRLWRLRRRFRLRLGLGLRWRVAFVANVRNGRIRNGRLRNGRIWHGRIRNGWLRNGWLRGWLRNGRIRWRRLWRRRKWVRIWRRVQFLRCRVRPVFKFSAGRQSIPMPLTPPATAGRVDATQNATTSATPEAWFHCVRRKGRSGFQSGGLLRSDLRVEARCHRRTAKPRHHDDARPGPVRNGKIRRGGPWRRKWRCTRFPKSNGGSSPPTIKSCTGTHRTTPPSSALSRSRWARNRTTRHCGSWRAFITRIWDILNTRSINSTRS